MIRVELPPHLRVLANVRGEVRLEVEGPVTARTVLDALETAYPMLRGNIRDHGTLKRRDCMRFFACQRDLSLESPDKPAPEPVAKGVEPFLVVGAIAGGKLGPGPACGESAGIERRLLRSGVATPFRLSPDGTRLS